MTTPAFNNTDTGLGTVRYYTQFDPYFYTVDNRPLQDMSANDEILSQGIDAARRGLMINDISRSINYRAQYGTGGYITGLDLSAPSNNNIQVNPGAYYTSLAINAGNSATIVKQAFNWQPVSFSIPAPTSVGYNIIYTIAIQYNDLNASNTSGIPYLDTSNSRLFENLLNGTLAIQIYAGTQAPAGSEVAPTIPGGWVGLYNVTVPYGATTWSKVVYASGAPGSYGLYHPVHTLRPTTTNGATSAAYGDMLAYSFADAASNYLNFTFPVQSGTINPYKPIKFRVMYGSSATGNIAFRINYQTLSSGNSAVPSYTTTGIDYLPFAAGAGANFYSFDTVNAVMPGSNAANALLTSINIERVGADGGDTNTGTFSIIRVIAFQ